MAFALAEYLVETTGESAVDFSTGSADLIFRPQMPCEVIRWGILTTVAIAGGALVMTGNHREAGGAALTPSGAGDAGTVTTPTSVAVGQVYYTERVNPNAEFAKAGGDRSAAGVDTPLKDKPFLVLPGEEVQFVSDNGPTSGNGVIWVHYRPLGWQAQPTFRARSLITAPTADDNWLYRTTKVNS